MGLFLWIIFGNSHQIELEREVDEPGHIEQPTTKEDSHSAAETASVENKQIAPTNPTKPMVKKSVEELSDHAEEIPFSSGEVIAETSYGSEEDQIGITVEAGGVGPVGFYVDPISQEVFTLDRINDRITSFQGGRWQSLLSLKDTYQRGIAGDGQHLYVLVGNTKHELLKYRLDGTLVEKTTMPYKVESMDAAVVQYLDPYIYIRMGNMTYQLIDKENVSSFHGAPMPDHKRTIDIEKTTDFKFAISMRDEENAVLKTKVLNLKFAENIKNVFVIEGNLIYAIFESSPFTESGKNLKNPFYIVSVFDENFNERGLIKIPYIEDNEVDQSLNVDQKGNIYQIQASKEGIKYTKHTVDLN
jgi:hypothetical protein